MHLVGFIVRICEDARSSECQISSNIFVPVSIQPVTLEVLLHGHVAVLNKLGVDKHVSVKLLKMKFK